MTSRMPGLDVINLAPKVAVEMPTAGRSSCLNCPGTWGEGCGMRRGISTRQDGPEAAVLAQCERVQRTAISSRAPDPRSRGVVHVIRSLYRRPNPGGFVEAPNDDRQPRPQDLDPRSTGQSPGTRQR